MKILYVDASVIKTGFFFFFGSNMPNTNTNDIITIWKESYGKKKCYRVFI